VASVPKVEIATSPTPKTPTATPSDERCVSAGAKKCPVDSSYEPRPSSTLPPISTQLAATWAITVGQLPQGIDFANSAIAQDPLGTANYELAKASYFIGALPQAADAYRQLLELYPSASAYHFRYAVVLIALGKPQAAYDEMMRDIPPYRQVGLPLALDALGRRADADRELAVAEQRWGIGMAYQISYVYASRNDPDRALYWLERAYKQHDAGLLSMLHDPMFKNIERTPQFQSLLRKMKLLK
jgi:tetratricopeptide (TPR) repeat protein